MIDEEIKNDLRRAVEALNSAKRNLDEKDIFTAANRTFVACENAVYVLLKSAFGSSSISRLKILTKLSEINPNAKQVYDDAYDLRVQADYGRKAKLLPLNAKNVEIILQKVEALIEKQKTL